MKLIKCVYEIISGKDAPYFMKYNMLTLIVKQIRKVIAQVIAPNCTLNFFRILLYRLCGFKIGKNVFIGMKCYLDDTCYESLIIGNDVTISYGVYFACHGKQQDHNPIIIEDGVYIGMRASIISKTPNSRNGNIIIGKNAIVGACTLVNKSIPCNCKAIGIPCKIIN